MELMASNSGELSEATTKLPINGSAVAAVSNGLLQGEGVVLEHQATPTAPPPLVSIINGTIADCLAINDKKNVTAGTINAASVALETAGVLATSSAFSIPVANNKENDLNPGLSLKACEEMLPVNEEINEGTDGATGEEEEERLVIHEESEEMEIQSEHNDLLQQSGTSKESELSIDSHGSNLSDSEQVSGAPSSSLINDSLADSHDTVSENISPDKMQNEKVIPAPSGVASFSLSSITLPDNALPASVNMSAHTFPKRHRHVHRAAVYAMHPYHRATCRGGAGVGVAKTLDLLKAVLQSSFNQEMKRLCDDYLQIFSVAAANIHENTRDQIPDSTLRLLVTKMMEEAQQGYQNGKWEFPSGQLPKNDRLSDSKGSPMSTKKTRTDKEVRHYTSNKRGRKPSEKVAENSRSAWKWSLDKRRLDPGKWSIDKLNSETLFVLGVNVNKALGHAANRGKVYILHPELFKYVCDGDDKTWLYDNKHLPVHGGKAFLLIYDEVESLVKTEDSYRDNPDILRSVQKLQRFSVPVFMENKMKDFVRNVQGYFAQENSTAAGGAGAVAESLDK